MPRISEEPVVTSLSYTDSILVNASNITSTITKQNISSVYNVRDYGAKGDGITDDGPAFNSCLAAAQAVGGVAYASRGTYNIITPVSITGNNKALIGDGIDQTILLNNTPTNSTVINLSSATNGPTPDTGVRTEGLTINMNSKKCYALSASWSSNVLFKRVKIINPPTSALSMMFVGEFSNQSAGFLTTDITIEQCIWDYGGVSASWEAVTLGYARRVSIINCIGLNKFGVGPGVLNYNSEEVTISGCYFYKFGVQSGGRGPLHIVNNRFEETGILVQGQNNLVISKNSFLGYYPTDSNAGRSVGIQLQGNYYAASGGESPWYLSTFPYTWNCTNVLIDGNIISAGNSYGIQSDTKTISSVVVLAANDLTITNNVITGCTEQGIRAFANYINLSGNIASNNGQLGSGTGQNFFIAATEGIFANNTSYDNQGSPTISHDVVFTNELVSSFFPTQTWQLLGNTFNFSPIYYYNSGFTSTNPGTITINQPVTGSFLPLTGGTLTGAEIVNVSSANALTVGPNGTTNPTLVANTSVASAATGVQVTGNAAGSWANIAAISSGATEILSIDSKDSAHLRLQTLGGSGQIDFGQQTNHFGTLAMQDAVNVSFGTTTGTKFGTSASQKIGFFNTAPIIQPIGDLITALTNLGLITSPTVSTPQGIIYNFIQAEIGAALMNVAGATFLINVFDTATLSEKVDLLRAGARDVNLSNTIITSESISIAEA